MSTSPRGSFRRSSEEASRPPRSRRRASAPPTAPERAGSEEPVSAEADGQRLLSFDRRIGARFVVGADEAGRGSLAGPLVVAGVLLDYEALRGSTVRPLALLNDSKQLTAERREELFRAVVGCAERISVQAFSAGADRSRRAPRLQPRGAARRRSRALTPPGRGLPRRRLPPRPRRPEHTAVVDGDERSAAIAAASIVAKVVRDRLMRRMDALYPAYGFASHVGYITPEHSARRARARAVRRPPPLVPGALLRGM